MVAGEGVVEARIAELPVLVVMEPEEVTMVTNVMAIWVEVEEMEAAHMLVLVEAEEPRSRTQVLVA